MRYLDLEERRKTRSLWEEAFPEDSREFDSYYYRRKICENRILAEEEDGEIVSMVQLNPYQVRLRDREYGLSYIVGVATRRDRRHRGHMRRLLTKMLADMRKEEVPFTFLMPAAEAIYRPFGFRYIYDQPHLMWKAKPGDFGLRRETVDLSAGQGFAGQESAGQESAAQESAGQESAAQESTRLISELAAWQQKFLTDRYEVCTVRDETYIRRLMEELASEDGEWTVFRDKSGEIAAMESWWGWETRELRFLYAPDGLTKESKLASPAIMARITCLEEFLKVISLTDSTPKQLRIYLNVKDPLIPENNGEFLWIPGRKTSEVKPVRLEECICDADKNAPEKERTDITVCLGIEELAEWLFGYRKPEHLPEEADWIRPLKGVFLDESV